VDSLDLLEDMNCIIELLPMKFSKIFETELASELSRNIIFPDTSLNLMNRNTLVFKYFRSPQDVIFKEIPPSVNIEPTNELALKEAGWGVEYYEIEHVDVNAVQKFDSNNLLSISFSPIVIERSQPDDNSKYPGLEKLLAPKYKISGWYLIWDYQKDSFVSKGRIRIGGAWSISSLISSAVAHIKVANPYL
jgi:hypothetical protein